MTVKDEHREVRLDNEPGRRDPVDLSLVPKTAPQRIAYVRNT